MKVVGYVRVSTDSQAEEGMGLEIQEDTIKKFCRGHKDYELVKIYSDPGISGSVMPYKRPGMVELFREAKEKAFGKVVVAKLDRLARDLYVQLWTEKELMVYDVEVFSIAEPYKGQDPMSTAMRQIVGVFAQLEKGRITERLTSGRLKKFSLGGYPGGNVSLGYVPVDGELRIDPEESETVRLIKKWRKQGQSMGRIARKLNEAGISTKRSGKKWYASTIRSILRNSIYKGKIRYAGKTSNGLHKPILIH
ncbi:hypothetical protein ES705_47385 [subsurface metagenome]